MKITDVSLSRVRGRWSGPAFPPGDRQARQLDIYPEFNRPAGEGGWPDDTGQVCAIYVEICTDDGISGLFGPIDESQAFVIQKTLRPFLIGRDPLANELLLDQMLRLDRHGRSGLFMTGVSPVDCALWDLKGKAWDQPVVRLLGGPTRPMVPLVEFLIQHQERKQFFHAPIYRPVEGSLELPTLPGLGLVLDEGKIEAREPPCS